MEDKRFEIEVRSLLENACEEVPAGLWDGIERQLPSDWAAGVRRRKLSNAVAAICAATAVAAATVLTVIFAGSRQDSDRIEIIRNNGATLAIVTEPSTNLSASALQASGIAAGQDIEITAVKASEVSGNLRVVSGVTNIDTDASVTYVADAEGSFDVADISAAEGSFDVADISAAEGNLEVAKASDSDKSWISAYESDSFDENGSQIRGHKKNGMNISAYGTALSNSQSQTERNSSIQRRPVTPKTTTISETSESQYSIPINAGIGVCFNVCNRFSIGTGVNWSYLSRKFGGQYNILDENGILVSQTSYTDIRNSQQFIGIPLNFYFDVIRRDFIDFYVYASGSANWCAENRFALDKSNVWKNTFNSWQFSAGIGMGVEFLAAKWVGFYVDPSLNYWFTKGDVTNIRTRQPLAVGFEIGVRFHI